MWMILGLLRLLIVSSNRLKLSQLFPDEIPLRLLLLLKDSSSPLSVGAATATITITASSLPHLRGSTPHLQDPECLMGHRRRLRLPPRLPRSPGHRAHLYPVRTGVCLVVARVRATDMLGTMALGFLRLLRFRRSEWLWRGRLTNLI